MKRVLTIFVSILILLSVIPETIAAPPEDDSKELVPQIVEALVSQIAEDQGIHIMSYANKYLTVGKKIPTYEYVDGRFSPLHFSFYPILCDDDLITYVMFETALDGAQHMTVTSYLKEKTAKYFSSASNIAFVYDNNSCYFYADGLYHCIATTSDISRYRDSIREHPPLNTPECASNETLTTFQLPSGYCESVMASYVSCGVSFVTQNPPSKYCWAAAIACIGNYIRRNDSGFSAKTAAQVAQTRAGNTVYYYYNISATPSEAKNELYSQFGVTYYYSSSVPSDTSILNNINNGYPLYASCCVVNAGTHATTIYGISVTGGYIMLMDPEISFCTAYYTYVSGLGYTYGYTSAYSGNYIYVAEHLYKL